MPDNLTDARSLAVAQAAHRAAQPDVAVLFGSRARGDYREGESDIDILMVQDAPPSPEQKQAARQAADAAAAQKYDHRVNVQIVWYRAEDFARYRRTVNHMVARALADGVIMPRNPAASGSQYAESSEDDCEYEWTVTQQRIRHAEQHLTIFRMAEQAPDADAADRMAGQHGQQALEHALKALISAHRQRYERVHQLNALLNQVRQIDPDFDFEPGIDYAILNQYAGSDDYYEPEQRITAVPGYQAAVADDVARILSRAGAVGG